MYGTVFALIPFLVVIPIALWTKQVIPGLVVGLLVGSYMLHPNVVGGLQASLTYLVNQVSVPSNANLLLFLFGFGSFVGLVRVTGGVEGFAQWMGTRIKTARGGYGVTWLTSVFTFMAPDFRIVAIAPIMKNVMTRLGVSLRQAAFMIDLTSTPLIALIPIGTVFVGYMIGLLGTSLQHTTSHYKPFPLLLASLPFNIFSWVALAYGIYVSFFHKIPKSQSAASTTDGSTPVPGQESGHTSATSSQNLHPTPQLSPHLSHRVRIARAAASAETGAMGVHTGQPDNSFPDALDEASGQVRPDASNLIFPLILLLILTFVLTWWSGHAGAANLVQAFLRANASRAMLEALIVTLVVSSVYYLFKRQGIDRIMFGFLSGGNEMMSVNVLLLFVWAVSAISADLGFAEFTQKEITAFVPVAFLVPALFVLGCLISYFIGSSFGAWAMLMPLGFAIANAGVGHLPLIAGAVFASGTFGGFASPLSDNTVAMATVTKLPLMAYANYKTRVAIWLCLVSTVLYLGLGWVMSHHVF
jgi:tetracycline resistance efflux pump